MKIGIIVYSKTGNTYSVGMKLKDQLIQLGHDVEITRLNIENEKAPQFETLPLTDTNTF